MTCMTRGAKRRRKCSRSIRAESILNSQSITRTQPRFPVDKCGAHAQVALHIRVGPVAILRVLIALSDLVSAVGEK